MLYWSRTTNVKVEISEKQVQNQKLQMFSTFINRNTSCRSCRKWWVWANQWLGYYYYELLWASNYCFFFVCFFLHSHICSTFHFVLLLNQITLTTDCRAAWVLYSANIPLVQLQQWQSNCADNITCVIHSIFVNPGFFSNSWVMWHHFLIVPTDKVCSNTQTITHGHKIETLLLLILSILKQLIVYERGSLIADCGEYKINTVCHRRRLQRQKKNFILNT